MASNKKPNTSRRGRRARKGVKQSAQSSDLYKTEAIPRNLLRAAPFPVQMVRTMVCNTGPLVQQSALASFIVYEFRINDVYSSFPALPLPNCFYYTPLSQIYARNRVRKFRCKYTVTSNEPALPVYTGLIFRDTQPSTVVTTRQLAIDALEVSPSSGPQNVGTTAGMSIFRSPTFTIHPGAVVGDVLAYMSDIDYAASSGAAPPQLVWGAFIVISAAAGVLTNGVFVDIFCEYVTQFSSII